LRKLSPADYDSQHLVVRGGETNEVALEESGVVIFAEVPKLWCSNVMAIMVVLDKQPFATSCFSFRVLSKCLNSLKANLVGSLAIRTD
jgi:hypothetical protein